MLFQTKRLIILLLVVLLGFRSSTSFLWYPSKPRIRRDNQISSIPISNPFFVVSSVRDASSFPLVVEMYKNAKGIIFDIDGTLADSWKLGFNATATVLEKNKIPPITEEVYHECTRYATPERLARHAGLQPGDAEFESVGQALAQQFDDLYVGLVSTETAGFFPGVSKLIENIPDNLALGILTNAAARYAHAVLEVNSGANSGAKSSPRTVSVDQEKPQGGSMYGRFRSIRGADNVPEPKPSPAGLLQVCRDLELLPEECVYIGDSPSDALAAQAAGMAAIGVTWGSHKEESLKEAPFTHLCRTVPQLQLLLPQKTAHPLSL